jgi:Lhr-like helicase
MLDALWERGRRPHEGVSALLLYPMNALVNDQVKRLDRWLAQQQQLRFFHFTGETPENNQKARRAGLEPALGARVRTREEARGNEDWQGNRSIGGPVPDIVITNYSMLEYMLCRPQDSVFFGKNLQVVVLDEAHLYTGTLAAEIALLLRRLLARCGKTPEEILFLAASATIGSGTDEQLSEQLRDFGSALFSREKSQVHAVLGRKQQRRFEGPTLSPPQALDQLAGPWPSFQSVIATSTGELSLLSDPQVASQLRAALASLGLPDAPAGEDRPAALLHHALEPLAQLRAASDLLFSRERLPLTALSGLLWGEQGTAEQRQKATIRLLTLGASARLSLEELPLLPHRLHSLVRAAGGLSLCLSATCGTSEQRILEGRGTLFAGSADRFPLVRCKECGEPLLLGRITNQGTLEATTFLKTSSKIFALDPWWEGPSTARYSVKESTGQVSGASQPGATLASLDTCPRCQRELAPGDAEDEDDQDRVGFFSVGPQLGSTIVAEAAVLAMPPHPSRNTPWLPARGRRLLAFSDSRREAARLGPRLGYLHERRLVRAAFHAAIGSLAGHTEDTRQWLLESIQSCEARLQQGNNPRIASQLNSWRAELDQLDAGLAVSEWPRRLGNNGTLKELLHHDQADRHRATAWDQQSWDDNANQIQASLASLLAVELARRPAHELTLEIMGIVEVTYPGLDRLPLPPGVQGELPPGVNIEALQEAWPSVLALLCDTLRSEGVLTLGSDQLDENYAFGSVRVGAWAAENQNWFRQLKIFVGATERKKRRSFAAAVLQQAGATAQAALQLAPRLLSEAFLQLASSGLSWIKAEERQCEGGHVQGIQLDFQHLALRAPRELYLEPLSGQVWTRQALGIVPLMSGTRVESVTSTQLDQHPRLGRARQDLNDELFTLGLWAEEHSAQRSPDENQRLQALFEAGVRNVLSATTTMELGIDIGGLSGVFLANVPPNKASYLQRAGRAGRRADGSSAVITYCGPRPFDREVFRRFGDYLERPLRKPLVLFDRERIVQRHAHAFLLGEFFQQQRPEQERTGAMNAFGRIGLFCGWLLPDAWRQQASRPPMEPRNPAALRHHFVAYLRALASPDHPGRVAIQTALAHIARGTPLAPVLENWPAYLQGVERDFEKALAGPEKDMTDLVSSYNEIPISPPQAQLHKERQKALAHWYQLKAQLCRTVIEALAEEQFLPRFGFPIGVHRLVVKVPSPGANRGRPGLVDDDSLKLERSALLSLSEYVPGSRLLAGGKVVTSGHCPRAVQGA